MIDLHMLWYAVKGCIQNTSVSFSSYLNKLRLGKINECETLLNNLEQEQQRYGFSDERKKETDITKSKLQTLLRARAEFDIHRTRRNCCLYGGLATSEP